LYFTVANGVPRINNISEPEEGRPVVMTQIAKQYRDRPTRDLEADPEASGGFTAPRKSRGQTWFLVSANPLETKNREESGSDLVLGFCQSARNQE
jgi:hypothetical protein